MKNKLGELQTYINSHGVAYDVIVVAETWITPADVNLYNIDGYWSYHNPRKERDGGGVSVWVHKKYVSYISYEYDDFFNNFLCIHIQQLNFKIIAIYNTNNNEFFNQFDQILTTNRRCIIVGDFNINLLEKNDTTNKYIEMITSNGFHILNKIDSYHSTRKTNTSKTIIDHISSDLFNKFFTISINSHCFTDHESLTIQIKTEKPICDKKKYTKTFINYPKLVMDYNSDTSDTNTYNQIHNKIKKHIEANKETRTVISSYKNKLPYVTSEIFELIKNRDKLYRAHKKYRNNRIIEKQFKIIKNKVLVSIRNAKKSYEANNIAAAGTDSRKIWKVLNRCIFNRINDNVNVINVINVDNILLTNPTLIAERLNQYFTSIGSLTENTNIDKSFVMSRYRGANAFCFVNVSDVDFVQILNKLKENTSPGYDEISVKMLKVLAAENKNSFVQVINKSINECEFPVELKISKIIPIFKKGRKDCMENYRPIAILPTFAKIIEYVLYAQLMDFLRVTNFFHPDQYGFLPNSGTEIAAVTFVQTVNESLDKNKLTSALFIDLQKAFDNVNRPLLIRKLCDLNVSNEVILLIISFLSNRKQFVSIGNECSSEVPSKHGVPQGSRLASVFFLVFINDIFNCDIEGSMQLYADDIVISYSCDNYCDMQNKMQNDVNKLKMYLKDNFLSINAKKTNFIIFNNRQCHSDDFNFKIFYDNEEISRVNDVIYLGLRINNKLNWHSHIDHVRSKISSLIGALRRGVHVLPRSSLIKIYFAHIYTHIKFMLNIYSNGPKYKLNCIKVLQNKALKIIFKKSRLTETSTLYNEQFLPLETLIKFDQIILIYKLKNNQIRHNIYIISNADIHRYNTRNHLVHQNFARTNSGLNSTIARATRTFNAIPERIKSINYINRFKKETRQYLCEFDSLISNS